MPTFQTFSTSSWLVVLASFTAVHCQEGFVVPADTPFSGVPTSSEARYKCSFTNLWTEENHPNSYPEGASWSSPLFVVHSDELKVWEEGEPASPGVADLAQTGQTIGLTVELLSGGDEVRDIEIGDPFVVDGSVQEQVLLDFVTNQKTPYMSTIARLDPSPDWFTGFSKLDLRQSTGNVDVPEMWYREFYVDTYPFTAGTMSGATYSDAGSELDPVQPIQQLTSNDSFLGPESTEILPVARWSCELLNTAETTLDDLFGDGSVVVSALESIEPTMGSSLDYSTVNPSQLSTFDDSDPSSA